MAKPTEREIAARAWRHTVHAEACRDAEVFEDAWKDAAGAFEAWKLTVARIVEHGESGSADAT